MISDEEYSKLLQSYNYSYSIGDVVVGKVIKIESNAAFIDINAKAIAQCPIREITYSKEQGINDILKENTEYEFMVNSDMDEDGIYQLSYKKVALIKNAKILEEKFKNNEIVQGTILSVTKGGYSVSVMGLKGFIPLSQMKDEITSSNQILDLKILALDVIKNNFVLSNKKIYEDSAEEIFNTIQENMIVKGKVVRLTDFGAFVDIGGVEALLPLSQMSWSWINRPSDILKVNEKIEVEIISIEKEKQRISLSLRNLIASPWEKLKEELKEEDVVEGKVTRIKDFGAFVEIKPQIEGLLSKQQLSEYFKINNAVLNVSDTLKLKIKKIDFENQKITFDLL